MDWKRFFDRLGLNGTRWQWRMMRWERALKGLFRGQRTASEGPSVTTVVIFCNLLLFTLMVAHATLAGVGPRALLAPPTELLLAWGGQFWPAVLYNGQWWRCLTYAFTHGGLIHLGFNMVVLYQVGPLIEAEIGRSRFILLYTLAALAGTVAGYFWHPMTPVVGASGALFGLIGFAVAWYHRLGPAGEALRNFMFRWALFAFVFGLLVGADNAAHLGGALAGAALGFVLPLRYRVSRKLDAFFHLLAAACVAAFLVSLFLLLRWVVTG